MRQRRFARRSQPDDDGIPPVKEPLKQLSSDTIIIAGSKTDKARVSASGCTTIHTIRDSFSGFCMAVPQHSHDKDSNYLNFKYFGGLAIRDPTVIVRSDAAKDLTLAVSDLGWHPEASLENRWPHNHQHERWHGTYKSVLRACMLQSGFPEIVGISPFRMRPWS